MVKIHIKRGTPIKNELFKAGILNIDNDNTLKISISSNHQIYVQFEDDEIEQIKENLKPLLKQPSVEGIIIADFKKRKN